MHRMRQVPDQRFFGPGFLFAAPFVGGLLGGFVGGTFSRPRPPYYPPYPPYQPYPPYGYGGYYPYR